MIAFRVLLVLIALGLPALLAPWLAALRRLHPVRGFATWLPSALLCLVPASAPSALAGTGRTRLIFVVAILGVVVMLKTIDWLARPRFEEDRSRVVLALTFWPTLQIEDVGIRIPDRRERLTLAGRRVAGGACAVVAGLALAAVGQALDVSTWGPWADSSLKVFEIYALAGGANSLMVGTFALAGFRATDGFRYPILATSVLDFWSRYNVWIHRWLERHIFEPIGRRRRRPVLGILAVFALSGLFHEYLFLPAVPAVLGLQLAFFSLHGVGAVAGAGLGRRIRARTGRRIPRALAVAATIAFVLATAPLFIRCIDRVVDLHRDIGARVLAGWAGLSAGRPSSADGSRGPDPAARANLRHALITERVRASLAGTGTDMVLPSVPDDSRGNGPSRRDDPHGVGAASHVQDEGRRRAIAGHCGKPPGAGPLCRGTRMHRLQHRAAFGLAQSPLAPGLLGPSPSTRAGSRR